MKFSTRILKWYDENARQLPWRVPPDLRASKIRPDGVPPDPYKVWLSEIMLQQTTVATVKERYAVFLSRWPDVQSLAKARNEEVMGEWAGLGYYARARNLHKCAKHVTDQLNGIFPYTEENLLKLPGIGPYSAAAISAICYDVESVVVDGNIERIISRVDAIKTPMPKAKAEVKEKAAALRPLKRNGDYIQGLMDIGANICTPKNPKCTQCPVVKFCKASRAGEAEKYPVKAPKKKKPNRYGVAFVIKNDQGEVCTIIREDKGLLGGMLALPSTQWVDFENLPAEEVLIDSAKAHKLYTNLEQIEFCHTPAIHIFTHFKLHLFVVTARFKSNNAPNNCFWTPMKKVEKEMPTAFVKALKITPN